MRRILVYGIGVTSALLVGCQVVPFTADTEGGICNTVSVGSANPEIVIDSDGKKPFVVTSILIRTGPQGQGMEGYKFLSINSVRVNGSLFETRTSNVTQPVDGWGVNESADLMGTPIRLTSDPAAQDEKGGNFPLQIVAEGMGTKDIIVELFCRADDFDLNIEAVRVGGWKPAADTVAVTYIPGN